MLRNLRQALIGIPITVVYTNGAKIHARLREFHITIEGSRRSCTWRSPILGLDRPLFFNVDEICAVWQGKV